MELDDVPWLERDIVPREELLELKTESPAGPHQEDFCRIAGRGVFRFDNGLGQR